MMISADLFLDCILLLVHDSGERNKKVVNEIVALYETEWKVNASVDTELAQLYIRIVKSVMSDGIDTDSPDQLRLLLLKFKSDKALEKRVEVYDLLYEMFTSRDTMEVGKLDKVAMRIQNALVWHRANKITRTMFGKLAKAADVIDPKEQAKELTAVLSHREDLELLSNQVAGSINHGLVDKVNFSDLASLKAAAEKRNKRAVTGVLKLGLQGLNRMFGKAGGVKRGESIVVNARSHNYKSGLLQSAAIWIPLYNTPVSDFPGRKPLVIMYSLENEAFYNFYWMAKKVYYQETGFEADTISPAELCAWMYEFMAQKGYALEIVRYLPSDFGYEDLVRSIAEYEANGYEVHAVVIDYMNNMKKGSDKNASNAGNHLLVKELYNKVCNYLKTKGIVLFTAHQLNRRADELAGSGKTNVVKYYSADHLADSVDVQREVDVSIFIEKELNHEGIPFLTMRLTKHRYEDETPEAHKYCAYMFHKQGIIDDINSVPTYIKDIYSYSLDQATNDNQIQADYKATEQEQQKALAEAIF